MKRFSIIVPAYNVAEYIPNCINSIKSQTFSDYEIIVVEDCSTDDGKTLNAIKQLKDITFVQNEHNRGLGGARNAGMEVATGEYIIFLDSDDILYSETVLEKLNTTIGNTTPDIIYMGFNSCGTRELSILPTPENCKKEYRLAQNKFTHAWSICWKNEFVKKHDLKFPENVIYEDVPFVFLGIALSTSFLIADYYVHTYTSGRPNSNSTKVHFKQPADTIKCIENLCSLKGKIPTEYEPYLYARIQEQRERLVVRLDRILNQIF